MVGDYTTPWLAARFVRNLRRPFHDSSLFDPILVFTLSSRSGFERRPTQCFSPPKNLMLDFYYEDRGDNDDVLLFILSGKMDSTQAEYLYGVIQKQIHRGHRKVILDCDGLDYISSMGLGMMLRLHSRMKKIDGEVNLARIHGIVADAIRLVRLDNILGVYDSVDEAVQAANADSE